jgi:hypothetical protein
MKLAAVLDLLIGAGLAWVTYEQRGALGSPDAWLVVGIGCSHIAVPRCRAQSTPRRGL